MLRDIGIGIASGLVASAAVGPIDKLSDKMVSQRQKRQEKAVREDSPHHIAGEVFGEKLLKRPLTEREKKLAQLGFSVAYGVGWGLVQHGVAKKFPRAMKYGGLPFSLVFFLACDGLMAPILKLSPSVHRLPWQLNTKEFINHATWTAVALSVGDVLEKKIA